MKLEYLEDLIYLAISTEESLFFHEFSKNAADSPDVHSKTVLSLPQEDLWCSIP